MRALRAAVVVTAALGLVGSLAGCEYASRKQQAQLLVDAASRLRAVGTSKGSLTVSVVTEKAAPGLISITGPRSFAVPPLPLQLSYADERASVGSAQTPGGAIPPAVFTGSAVYFRRPGSTGAEESQFGFLAWSKLDFAKVGRKDTNLLGSVNVTNPINPTYLVRLLAGTLSGSVKRIGPETIDGVATTHYSMNVDVTKAFARLGDHDRQAVDKAIKSDNLKGAVYKHAEVWLDAGGLPRRLVLRLRQQLDPDVVFALTYTMDLTDFGAPVKVTAPSPDTTANVTTLNALLESARS